VRILGTCLLIGSTWAFAQTVGGPTFPMPADIDAIYPDIDALYIDLHQHPELAFQE
jgi:hypothetical protein